MMISVTEMPPVAENIKIENGKTILAVTVYVKPAAETVILLHGGPGVPDEMTEVCDWFSSHMQVINFDQRGTGFSENKNCGFTMAEYVSDINSICEYFRLDKVHLFGHSWGGLYAQLYALEYPQKVKSLFLCSPASGSGKIWTMTEREIFRYNYKLSTLYEWVGMGINAMLGSLGSNSAYRRLYRQIIINYHKGYNVEPPEEEKLARINARAGTRTRTEIKKHPGLGIFGKTPYPVMITYGQHDAYGQSRQYLLDRFPDAKKAIIPDSGHTPWKHNLKAFEKVLGHFYL